MNREEKEPSAMTLPTPAGVWLLLMVLVFVTLSPSGMLLRHSSFSLGAETRILIRDESGPEGHTTIGIDEKTLDINGYEKTPVTFRQLGAWEFSPGCPAPLPEDLEKADKKIIQITGFMYPLQEGTDISFFCLMRSTQTCCYGPRPEYNQYILVEMNRPVKFYRTDPVSCTGRFHVEPNIDEGYIYRMEGIQCRKPTSP